MQRRGIRREEEGGLKAEKGKGGLKGGRDMQRRGRGAEGREGAADG